MIAQPPGISYAKAQEIKADYQSGMSVYLLHMKHYPASRPQITQLLRECGLLRAPAQKRDPSPEEIAERAREVREGLGDWARQGGTAWSELEVRRRWVGSATASFQSSLVGED